ncbi:hypothetical protein ABT369_00150 [Dactylosporangium sp. NPDC000244]|uniref:hypothetical protein n=1 Tax=Dactylosporangium sp. NPDC000244 TaxID=3154365 RepID=UPI00331EF080
MIEATAADRDLWAAVVEAEQTLSRLRAEFYQRATGRAEVLRQALRGSNRERSAALQFLQHLPADVPELAESLAYIALSEGWAGNARRALQRGSRAVVREKVACWAMDRLPDADEIDYSRVAEILIALEMWPVLRNLVQQAEAHWNADIREVGRDVMEQYGPMITAS